LERIEDGVATVLATRTAGLRFDARTIATVEADGPELRAYLGDTLILEAEDATFAHGGVGLLSSTAPGARFDDLLITPADPRGDACDPCPSEPDGSCAPTCDDTDADGYGSSIGACGQPTLDCAPDDD